jgi:hypothetical protein|nr:MAG TPA: hypothetical protein [Caudoviricetes sp.]
MLQYLVTREIIRNFAISKFTNNNLKKVGARPKQRLKNMMYVSLQDRFSKFENSIFTEKELRGLSTSEKEFVRENSMSRVFRQEVQFRHFNKIYLFIAVDRTTGRKHLYGQTKWQVLCPNRKDTCYMQGAFNYNCWLLPQLFSGCDFFSPGCCEIRVNMPSWRI